MPTVCGSAFLYGPPLGWNAFPALSEHGRGREDLTTRPLTEANDWFRVGHYLCPVNRNEEESSQEFC